MGNRKLLINAFVFWCVLLITMPVQAAPGGPVDVGYLVDEDFFYDVGSGWDINTSGGTAGNLTYAYGTALKVSDTSSTLPVTMNRQFVTQNTGTLTLEYRFKVSKAMSGTSWQLRSGTTPAVNVWLNAAGLGYKAGTEDYTMLNYAANTEYGVKVIVNLDNKTADIYVNGVLKADKAPFMNPVANLDNLYVQTGPTATGDLYFAPVKIYKGYQVHERFLTLLPGAMPTGQDTGWQVNNAGGTLTVTDMASATRPDTYSLVINDGSPSQKVAASKPFPQTSVKTVFEYKFLLPAAVDGMIAEIKSGSSSAFTLKTSGGNLCYVDAGGNCQMIQGYLSNLWYHVKIIADPGTGEADVFVNGKVKVREAAFRTSVTGFDSVNFETPVSISGVMWLDDILVYTASTKPLDYVPAPEAAPTSYHVGMQVCSLWREGHHIGWDKISRYPERKPYLGFYDEGSTEAADWEIKWMLEHGITYQLYCWYRPGGGSTNSTPIKDPYEGFALHEGFFNAEYSSQMKFAIMWENGASRANGSSDFRNNVIPYWMEYYFKDPRYLVLDNKPVISFYSLDKLKDDFGGIAGVKAEMDYLRQVCKEAGFADAIILSTYAGNSSVAMEDLKDAGIDAVYAYTWDTTGGSYQYQKARMTEQKSTGKLEVIPTLSVGRDDSAWTPNSTGKYVSPGDYEILARWAKDTFLPSMADTSFVKTNKMVLLDNWNEFGEGHYIMPAARSGFLYLDALRNVFTTGGAHTDIQPTQTQLDRINTLYPSDRTQSAAVIPGPTTIPSAYRKIWEFNTNGNMEGWTTAGISSGAVSSGAYTATVTGTDPALTSPDNLNEDISNCHYVKLRMKNSSDSYMGKIYFSTTSETTMDESKVVTFITTPGDSEYIEYYIDMRGNSKWKGTLKKLRVDPIDKAGQFSIDYVGIIDVSLMQVGENLAADPGFEGSVIQWGSWQTSLALSKLEFQNGNQCLKAVNTSSSANVNFAVPLKNRNSYYYSIWARLSQGAATTPVLRFCVQYNLDGVTKQVLAGTGNALRSSQWTQVSGVFRIEETGNVTNTKVFVYTDLPADLSAYYLDSLEIRQVASDMSLKVTDGSGVSLNGVLRTGINKATVNAVNLASKPRPVTVIMALYHGSQLEGITCNSSTIGANTNIPVSISTQMNLANVSGYKVRVFVWDALNTRLPLMEGQELVP